MLPIKSGSVYGGACTRFTSWRALMAVFTVVNALFLVRSEGKGEGRTPNLPARASALPPRSNDRPHTDQCRSVTQRAERTSVPHPRVKHPSAASRGATFSALVSCCRYILVRRKAPGETTSLRSNSRADANSDKPSSVIRPGLTRGDRNVR